MTPAAPVRNELEFPARCPNCGEEAGKPYMAGTSCQHERIRVGMRCVECTHEWHFDMPTVFRKVDRRAKPRH